MKVYHSLFSVRKIFFELRIMRGGYAKFSQDKSEAFGLGKFSEASHSRELCDVASGASDFAQLVFGRIDVG